MAYAAVENNHEIRVHSGRRYLYVKVSETEASSAAGAEFSFKMPFTEATLVKYKATLTAGTGTTINPKLGKATGWTASTQNDIGTNSTTAAHIDDESKVTFYSAGVVFVHSQANNAATNHSITTEMIFIEGLI